MHPPTQEKKYAVIKAGESEAKRLDHYDPKPVPGGMDTLKYRHNSGTDAVGENYAGGGAVERGRPKL